MICYFVSASSTVSPLSDQVDLRISTKLLTSQHMNEAVAEKRPRKKKESRKERAYRSMCRTIYLVNIYLSEQVDESVRDWNNA
jgi:hypothetical protein